MLWTAVTANGTSNMTGNITYDWRPMAEFHADYGVKDSAQTKCQSAARQLGLKSDRYRCIHTK
jgi:hypothetical protein